MKIIELEKFIQNLSPELYSFAYILIPDDLQATQLMIDAVSSFMVQKKSHIDRFMQIQEKDEAIFFEEIKINLFKSMFEISKKRINQLKLSLSHPEEDHSFFKLEFDDKAALFLKERGQFDLEAIESILGQTRAEVLAHLYSARLHLSERLPSIYSRSIDNNMRDNNNEN